MSNIIRIKDDYQPSIDGYEFHKSNAMFRFLIWGIKSGKTKAGAKDFNRGVMARPGSLNWLVAPSYPALQAAEHEMLRDLYQKDYIHHRNRSQHFVRLRNGAWIYGRSAERVDNLRGLGVDTLWIDEGGHLKEEAWWICQERVAATKGPITVTTTPHGRTWIWNEVQDGGMPPTQAYGNFTSSSGDMFVSHWPTWHFDWVDQKHIDRAKRTMPREIFDQEYGALFITTASSVFHHVEESVHAEPPVGDKSKIKTIMGLDLAKWQDYTVVTIMDGRGVVRYIERWTKTEWTIQKVRIKRLADEWNSAIVMDSSNVGSVIEEDLRKAGLNVHCVDMNSADVKNELIQNLQIAFEQSLIRIPDWRTDWARPEYKQLYDELKCYEHFLTKGGRLSYSAPKGLTDDCVISLSLANWGRMRGLAGSVTASVATVTKNESMKSVLKGRRETLFSPIGSRRKSIIGVERAGTFWR